MRMTMIRPTNDMRGNNYHKHVEYNVSDETARRFSVKKMAEKTSDITIRQLASFGGGLLLLPSTEEDLKEAAREAGIQMFTLPEAEETETKKEKKKK